MHLFHSFLSRRYTCSSVQASGKDVLIYIHFGRNRVHGCSAVLQQDQSCQINDIIGPIGARALPYICNFIEFRNFTYRQHRELKFGMQAYFNQTSRKSKKIIAMGLLRVTSQK
jgi:hypothetical protein